MSEGRGAGDVRARLRRRPSLLALTCLVLAVALAVVLLLQQQRGPDCGQLAQQARARVDAPGGAPLGGGALEDLATCRTLEGLRRQEVRRVLGPPDEESDRTAWSYASGEADEVGDGVYLDITFDADGRVTSAAYDA